MNKNFPEWYSTANIAANDSTLESRWKGIEKFCEENINTQDVLELTRIFFNRPVEDKFRENFVNVFFEIDKAFPQKNDLELSVLAGAALIDIIERYDGLDDLAMLALMALSFNNRKMFVPNILKEVNNEFIIKTSKIRNDLGIISEIETSIPSVSKLLENFKAGAISPELAGSFSTYFADLTKLLEEVLKSTNTNARQQQIYREDSQILWWMTGEWSRDLQKPFKEMKTAEVSFIIGKELADLVKVLPGPYASKAVLNKTLRAFSSDDQRDTILLAAVNALNKDWKLQVLKTYPADKTKEITPLLAAISCSLQVEKAIEWKSLYKKLTGFDPSTIKITSLEFAYQMYLECLVVKSIADNND